MPVGAARRGGRPNMKPAAVAPSRCSVEPVLLSIVPVLFLDFLVISLPRSLFGAPGGRS